MDEQDDTLEFAGKLEEINPSKLINEEKEDPFQSFFIALGLIFNDFKGLILLDKLLRKSYRKPEDSEVSVQQGEYAGIRVQINKLIIAVFREFLDFLKQNKNVTGDIRFLLLLKGLSPSDNQKWKEVLNLIQEKKVGSTKFLEMLQIIRSNIAFHYDHSGKILRKGFIESLIKNKEQQPQYKRAMYSLGDNMETTRFYFSDAAAGAYMKTLIPEEISRDLMNLGDDMNRLIAVIMKQYILSLKKNNSKKPKRNKAK
jgi:hypothetical protein